MVNTLVYQNVGKYTTLKINHKTQMNNGFYTRWSNNASCYTSGLIISPNNEKASLFKYPIDHYFDAIVVINDERPLKYCNF